MVLPSIPTPDSLKGVDDLIRSGFEAYRESWFTRLLVATGLVVVGLLFEAVELVPEIVLIIRRKRRERRLGIKLLTTDVPEWLKTVAFVGWFLVVAGVAGEFVADSFVSKADGFVQKFDEILLAEATINAGNAATSAKTAHNEADAVRKEANAIDERLDNASAKLGKLGGDVLAQGPRWRALEHGQAKFISDLKPFPGQQLTVVICDGHDDSERFPFEQKLMDLVRKAGWASPEYKTWQGCPDFLTGGNEIFAVSSVNLWQHVVPYFCRGVHDIAGKQGAGAAAETLCDVLNKLRISTTAFMLAPGNQRDFPMETAPVNQLPVALWARGFFGSGTPDSPAELAVEQPTKIFFLVGPK